MLFLNAEKIEETIIRLHTRINERFPNCGLSNTCKSLLDISKDVKKTTAWINSPNYFVRISSWVIIVLLVGSVVRTCALLHISLDGVNIADVFQMIDAAFNSLVLVGASGIFLMTSEVRRKRKRVLEAVNELRSIAHIVDAH